MRHEDASVQNDVERGSVKRLKSIDWGDHFIHSLAGHTARGCRMLLGIQLALQHASIEGAE